MPPLPISWMISSRGNFSERSVTGGGLNGGAGPSVSGPVGKAAFSRHSWQSPFGALAASGLPQLGHRAFVSIFDPTLPYFGNHKRMLQMKWSAQRRTRGNTLAVFALSIR